MTRILPSVRLAMATVVVAALSALAFVGASGTLDATPASAATPLPAGWELCILQGIGAPLTGANVANLDEWQVKEGGSTNNSADYNPFNTRRTTDANNAPIPLTMSSNGFPAFTNWLGGCAATVATLFQPNMWSIDAALRAGNVAPPGAFLAAVDQSQWCAPSADGTPCYVNSILGVAGATMANAVLSGSSALDVFGNVQNDVRTYQLSVLAVSNDQNSLNAKNKDQSNALAAEQSAHTTLDAATQALRKFAVDEYVSTGLYVSTSLATGAQAPRSGFGPQDANGVVAHQYESIAAGDLVNRDQAAIAVFKAARLHVKDTSQAVAVAFATLAKDSNAQTMSLAKLVADVATMQTAGACLAITLTTAALPSVPGTGSGSGSTTSTTTTTTTTPTTLSAPTTSTTSTTTTSTTLPGGSGPSLSPTPTTLPDPTTTTTTTTLPPTTTTTTTTLPPTTTTTTTAPPTPAQPGSAPAPTITPPVSADPAAFGALQGCMAALAPPASTT